MTKMRACIGDCIPNVKPLEEFGKARLNSTNQGHQTRCKLCVAAKDKKRKLANPRDYKAKEELRRKMLRGEDKVLIRAWPAP